MLCWGALKLINSSKAQIDQHEIQAMSCTLKLGKSDKNRYAILPDDEVQPLRVIDGDDPLPGEFLSFLSQDMAKHPEEIRVLDASLKSVMDELSAGLVLNLDQALSPDDE